MAGMLNAGSRGLWCKGAVVGLLGLAMVSCSPKQLSFPADRAAEPAVEPGAQDTSPAPLVLQDGEKLVAIIGTNDVHGGIEPTQFEKHETGGAAFFSGVVSSLRSGIAERYGVQRSGLLLVDGGDQYQGTLLSNFDEGKTVFMSMELMGYDAAVLGNHGYDFGPSGWDKDAATALGEDPRGVVKDLIKRVSFPILSANTYYRESILDIQGNAINPAGERCMPTPPSDKTGYVEPIVDWSKAKAFELFAPYTIRNVAGLRVALIGIDNPGSGTQTTISNVSDLCFADEAESFLRVRDDLEGKADIFVMLLHDSAASGDLVRKINAKGKKIDAIIAGHTHKVEKNWVDGVPVIQSGNGGRAFGRVDLVWNETAKAVDTTRSRAFAGVALFHADCDKEGKVFCATSLKAPTISSVGINQVSFEGTPVLTDTRIEHWIAKARELIAPVAGRKLGTALARVDVERIKESPLADILTDKLREGAKAEISFLNTGGIRAPIEKGDFDYEALFKVIPFNNHAVLIEKMSRATLLKLLKYSAETCGDYSALIPSGIRMVFTRDCSTDDAKKSQRDKNAELLHVEMLDGTVILDKSIGDAGLPAGTLDRTFVVATLDFLSQGGSGYAAFLESKVTSDLGIFREVLTEELVKSPITIDAKIDGRYNWKFK